MRARAPIGILLTHALLVASFAAGAMAAWRSDPPPADPFKDHGVPVETRRKALAKRAKEKERSELLELLDAVNECGDCAASRDLAGMLESWDAKELAAPQTMTTLIEMAAPEKPAPVRVAAARAVNAVPEASRPDAAKPLAVQRIEIVCVPAAMRWDPKDVSATAGRVVEIRMKNDDTLVHNLLVTTPGSLAEIGVAADRFGETAEGKAREYVPDSPKVLHVMGLIDPGKTGSLWFIAPEKPGTYPLICTYPGHWRMMNGKLRVKAPE
ncbi:MAG: hypothetical protein FJ253_10590 [Phycisphaerae bacterium]|nr:hypothetical protein [Phycisphaerae bacterium]